MDLNKIKGTKDIFGAEVQLWQKIEKTVHEVAQTYHLSEIRTPIFEYSDVFKRAIGQETDIVSKEMFELTDRGGRNLCLRPEGTAGVVRALIENSLFRTENPRYYYMGPMFRAERPQKGRQRQFHQIGIEIFDEESPFADLDVILFNIEVLKKLNIEGFSLKINSVGCPKCRPGYLIQLKDYLKNHVDKMCDNCQQRYHTNVLRVLDCKNENCKKINDHAPHMIQSLCESCGTHFNQLKSMLDTLKIQYAIDTSIVRGLDYYTKTVFEIQISYLGAQNAVCGGGRYDGLVSFFDPKTSMPAVGSAIGIERLIIAIEEKKQILPENRGLDYYLIIDPALDKNQILPILFKLRRTGFSARIHESGKNIGKQFKEANKLNAQNVLIFGEDEIKSQNVSLKDMKTGEQKTLALEAFLNSLMI